MRCRFSPTTAETPHTAACSAARNSTDAIEIIKTPPCAPRANAICERLPGHRAANRPAGS
jgi:hypothetical protein